MNNQEKGNLSEGGGKMGIIGRLLDSEKYKYVAIFFVVVDLCLMGLEITETAIAKTTTFNIISYIVQFIFVFDSIFLIRNMFNGRNSQSSVNSNNSQASNNPDALGSLSDSGESSYVERNWNILNILVTIITIIPISIWGEYSDAIRALRVLRIFRLFSHINSFKVLMTTVGESFLGVSWTGLFLLIIMYCYAVEGTLLFGDEFNELFGTTWRALFSLFQIMTFESWSMGIARPIMKKYPSSWIYFISYSILSSLIILNVVQGYIVDAIMERTKKEKEKQRVNDKMKYRSSEDDDEMRVFEEVIERIQHVEDIVDIQIDKKRNSIRHSYSFRGKESSTNDIEMKETSIPTPSSS